MIEVEIIDTPDSDFIMKYNFNKNLIYIGKHPVCDIYIHDDEVIQNHVFIEIISGKLIIHPHPKVEFILIEGKRTTSTRYLKINEIIKIGQTQFKVTNYALTEIENYKTKLNQTTDHIIATKPEILELINLIKEDQ